MKKYNVVEESNGIDKMSSPKCVVRLCEAVNTMHRIGNMYGIYYNCF